MSITDQQRAVWERRIGTIGVAYTEKYVAETLDELAKANPLRFECPWCECKWLFHTQAQLDMIQRHVNAHMEALRAEIEALVAPVSDKEGLAFERSYGEKLLLNYVECGLSDFIDARKAVQAAVGSLSAMDRAEMEKEP